MALPAEASSHHTVWVTGATGRAVPIRYATVGNHLYCFGDDGLRTVADGERVRASIHRIANGPPIAAFAATLRTVAADESDREALLELLAHVPLGRSIEEVERNLEKQRHRRVVELVP